MSDPLDDERPNPASPGPLWSESTSPDRKETEEDAGSAATADAATGDETVAEAVAPTQVKVCPRCSVQDTTTGEFCPHCGARYAKRKRSKRSKVIAGAVVLVVLLVAGGVAAALKISHDDDVAAQREKRHKQELLAAAAAKAEQQREELAAERARQEAAADRALDREIKKSIEHSMEKSITKDAKKNVDNGILEGPILGTQCDQAPGDARKSATPYSCLAITKRSDDGTIEGYTFTATANLKTGEYRWHLGRD